MAETDMYLMQSTDVASRTIGDDTIIMSMADSTVYMLNAVGTVIWNAADGLTPLSKIIEEQLCRKFDVPSEQAAADAEDFAKELAEHGILFISDLLREAKENL